MTQIETIKKVIGLLQELIKEEEQEVQANLIAQQCVQAVSEIQAIPKLPSMPEISMPDVANVDISENTAPIVEIPEKGDIVVPEINKVMQMPELPPLPTMPEIKEVEKKVPDASKLNTAINEHGMEKCIHKLELEGYTTIEANDLCLKAIIECGC